MYEEMTQENLLAEMQDLTTDGIDTSEGSLLHSVFSAVAYELEKLYIQMGINHDNAFAESADIEHLEMRTSETGVYRKEATAAKVKAIFNIPVPLGTRFSNTDYTYVVDTLLNDTTHEYQLTCETAGAEPNGVTGDIFAIDHVDGLESATIEDLIVAGTDAEDRDSLYERYQASFHADAFGGNIADYKQLVNAYTGVGGCKVIPAWSKDWNGGGTVKIVVISSDFTAISSELCSTIQSEICPEPYEGNGKAGIGHYVTIAPVTETPVNVSATLTLETDADKAIVLESIKAAIAEHLLSLTKTWADGTYKDHLSVYPARVSAKILDIAQVVNVTDVKLNDSSDTLALGPYEIPVIGEVTA